MASGRRDRSPAGSEKIHAERSGTEPVQSNQKTKRTLFDKAFGFRHKQTDVSKGQDATKFTPDPSKIKALPPVPSPNRKDREPSTTTIDSGTTLRPSDNLERTKTFDKTGTLSARPARFGRGGAGNKRGQSYEILAPEEPSSAVPQSNLFDLFNLEDMSDIIKQDTQASPVESGIFTGEPQDVKRAGGPETPIAAGAWDAPDSWAVKRMGDDVVGRLPEIGEDYEEAAEEDDGTPYCMRVFRNDGTFATISTSINATAADIVQQLAKKSVMQHSVENYQIVIRKNDLQRQLDPGERPVAIQKRLLEQAGYEPIDRIEEIGREDNSYLCRFTFTHEKQMGFYSLERDPSLARMQKISHVDLSGRSLATIPITLYQKASEIISLNVSRNLALDVPKDFLQACVNLREIKYISNEAWRLPASLSWASRLTVLDVSNNRIERLDHAELYRLQSLVSIKLTNNKLTELPEYFGSFKALRHLTISSNNFQELPDHLCNLKSLVELDISFNRISTLPRIGDVTSLERIVMTNNQLSGPFEETWTKLVNLKEIDARFNNISNIENVACLPKLEQLLVGHNQISTFVGSFPKLRILLLDHCPVTQFDLDTVVPTLTTLNIASAKVAAFGDSIFENMPNLTKLILDKNLFINFSANIGKLLKLEHFSIAKNPLSSLPASVGCLAELKFLNLRECNIKLLPPEIWYCAKLETLNVSSNVLELFPKQGGAPPPPGSQIAATPTTPGLSHSPSFEELGKLEDFGARRPSATSGLLSAANSPASSGRKASIASIYGQGGRKASVISRTTSDGTVATVTRKDSNLSQQKLGNTFASSLKYLYLADNRLDDDVFRELHVLVELRVLNLAYNALSDLPHGVLRRWPNLTELYLSGNDISSLPSDDLEEGSNLRVLHINGNKFQVLPAELCKVKKLAVLDVGSNSLKYNVSNWPYDWNWTWNINLKYLNFSGNKRLEIKPNASTALHTSQGQGSNADLTNFNSLNYLRVLGLMDVTLTIRNVPDENEDRRVRTSASLAGAFTYGMADTLGRNEHLSTFEMLIPQYRSNEMETLVGMFDGQTMSAGGSKIAKFLHDHFRRAFAEELGKLPRENEEWERAGLERRTTPCDALRRTFLSLNKDMAAAAATSLGDNRSQRGSTISLMLTPDDLSSFAVATILYLQNTDLYVANVGDAEAVIIQNNAKFRTLTAKHDPADMGERERIRNAGGYVSRYGKLNDTLEISRAFGCFQLEPCVIASPHTSKHTLTESDELILIASKEFWDYVTPDLAVDVARDERSDLMIASQKLRDLAIAYGATNKIMVMMIGISDLRKRGSRGFRGTNLSMTPSYGMDDQIFPSKRGKKGREVGDSRLARLDEPEAPVGEVAIVFTDIKNSTALWEVLPVPMRSAIQLHNELFRRQLRLIGGYEVKTEGDAFMVSFPTVTSALLWCFSCQSHLLELPWPTDILETTHCTERYDSDGNVIYRGLSVRMGIHWGRPVCEMDPITRRMDYFGPMVNRAARISGVADGGQITVSTDFIGEIHRTLEAYADTERNNSAGSEETMSDTMLAEQVQKELRQLSSQGFEVKDLGERKLKGLENPEVVYLMYPHSLAGRLALADKAGDAGLVTEPGTLGKNTELNIEPDTVWSLWDLALRLEMLCSALEDSDRAKGLKKPELSLLNRMKNQGGEITDEFMLNLLEHQVTRIETCSNTLLIRHLTHPLRAGDTLYDHARPMGDVMAEVIKALAGRTTAEHDPRPNWQDQMEYEATKEELRALKAHMRALERRAFGNGEGSEDDEDDMEDMYED
ncbi:putative adenylate cyclase [Phaeomoniella chlamydospora]|uniref:Adenylate cyclase n=1 Tax=Phaeomoniella chlamydospora TaxID=158046 RepID=A0A0G2H9X4_PHACM|nr:putative adenylate cyclase [Phaeomoniella chlamydospora]